MAAGAERLYARLSANKGERSGVERSELSCTYLISTKYWA
jgi:hypothetical protein